MGARIKCFYYFLILFLLVKFISTKYYLQQSESLDIHNLNFELPTEEEIKRAVVVNAPSFWGQDVRETKSLRILLLGGSNTRHGDYAMSLKNGIEMLMNQSIIASNSYVLNEGLGGPGPAGFYSAVFQFEEKWIVSHWPNVVILEFSVNSVPTWPECALRLDNLIHILRTRWKTKGLIPPSFLILDLFRVGPFVSGNANSSFYEDTTTAEKSNRTTNLERLTQPEIGFTITTKSFYRGSPESPCIASVARFYCIPMISFADAMFPSFTRFLLASTNTSHQRWPFSKDGIHLSKLGAEYLVQKMLFPFLVAQAMGAVNTDLKNVYSIYTEDIRMFPKSFYTEERLIARFSSWNQQKSFQQVIINTSSWIFQSIRGHEMDQAHICYGSTNFSSPAWISIPTRYHERDCSSLLPCSLRLGYVHSWNTSYIGNMECNLFPLLSSFSGKINESLLIDRKQRLLNKNYEIIGSEYKGLQVQDTTVRKHTITNNLTFSAGRLLLECKGKANAHGLLNCIAEVDIVQLDS